MVHKGAPMDSRNLEDLINQYENEGIWSTKGSKWNERQEKPYKTLQKLGNLVQTGIDVNQSAGWFWKELWKTIFLFFSKYVNLIIWRKCWFQKNCFETFRPKQFLFQNGKSWFFGKIVDSRRIVWFQKIVLIPKTISFSKLPGVDNKRFGAQK